MKCAPELHLLGVLTGIDQEAFERYCEGVARWRNLRDWLADNEPVTDSGQIHAKANLANKLSLELLKFETQFGKTPVSRSQLAVTSAPKGETESIEEFAARKPLAIVKGA